MAALSWLTRPSTACSRAALRCGCRARLPPPPPGHARAARRAQTAFYFEFIAHLTRGLVAPALGSVCVVLCYMVLPRALPSAEAAERAQHALTAAYAVCLVLWAAWCVEAWKRREARCALDWGTLALVDAELDGAPRVGFRGTLRVFSPLTRQNEWCFPPQRRALRYALTVPATLTCLAVVGADMYVWLWAYYAAVRRWSGGTLLETALQQLPTAGYCLSVAALSALYRPIAAALTEYENYRTSEAHRNALIVKRVLFEMANNFSTLYYIAFCNRDLAELRSYLLQLLVVFQIIFQLIESAGPALGRALGRLLGRRKRREAAASRLRAAAAASAPSSPTLGADAASAAERAALLADVETQLELPPYDPFDDFVELAVQFGNVLLFAAVLPIAPVFALANNLPEIRADALKLMRSHRRPAHADGARQVHGIGAWLVAFQVITGCAALTNLALLTYIYGWLEHLEPSGRLVVFLSGQQLVLGAMAVLALLAPKLPHDVAVRVAVAVDATERSLREIAAPLATRLRHHHRAASRIQAAVRAALARRLIKRCNAAALTIQATARDFLGRSRRERLMRRSFNRSLARATNVARLRRTCHGAALHAIVVGCVGVLLALVLRGAWSDSAGALYPPEPAPTGLFEQLRALLGGHNGRRS